MKTSTAPTRNSLRFSHETERERMSRLRKVANVGNAVEAVGKGVHGAIKAVGGPTVKGQLGAAVGGAAGLAAVPNIVGNFKRNYNSLMSGDER